MIGNIASQFISIISYIYIVKILGPINYGIYATVIAFVGIFNVFTLNGLSKALIREGSKNFSDFNKVIENSLGIKFLFIITSVLICNITSIFVDYNTQTKFLIILFSIELFDIGFSSYFSTIFQVVQKMKYLAYFSILSKTTFSLLSISLLMSGFGVTAVIIANLFSNFTVLLINFLYSRKYVSFKFNLSFKIETFILKSSIIFTLIAFVNTLATKIDILMISFLSSSKDVGIYSVAYKITSEGEILRNVIATAFFPIIVKFYHDEQNPFSIFKPSIYFLIFLITALSILSIFSKDIIIMIFGQKYGESGSILRYLLFSLAFSYYTIPFTLKLQTTNNEILLLLSSLIITLLNIPLNIIFFHHFGLIGIAYSTLVVYFTNAIILTILPNYFL